MRGALACLALLAAAGAAGADSTLTVCTSTAPDGFDIAQSQMAATVDAAGNTIHDQLLRYKPGTTELVPGLAESWDVSADGRQVTLHLRHGVKFHTTPWFTPTRDMNADDVLFSIQRMAEPKGAWRGFNIGEYLTWNSSGLATQMKSIEKLDDMTVRITLQQPSAPFLNYLTVVQIGSVFPAEYAEQLRKSGKLDRWEKQPVGAGPFVFRSYQKDAVIRYAAHPGYWGGRPKIERLVFAITPDANVRLQRLKAGECLVGGGMPGTIRESLVGTPLRLLGMPSLTTSYIILNTRHRFLSDPRFRQALALAFDRPAYLRSVYEGQADPASSFLPGAQWGHDASLAMRLDPEQAKQLVKASGYDGSELVFFIGIGGSFDGKRAGELLQRDWARIGVKVRVLMLEFGELLHRTGRGEQDLALMSNTSGGDPDDFFRTTLSCQALAIGTNDSQWCDPAFDALLDAARATTDRARRVELYRQVQRKVFDALPVIPTAYPQTFTAVHDSVRGFVPSPLASLDFRNVSVSAP